MPTRIRSRLAASLAIAFLLVACTATPQGSDTDPGSSVEPSVDASGGSETDDCGIAENADGSLEPLADGFPNQPITISHHQEAGGTLGVYARQLSELGLSELSPVRVTVSDRPDFGTYGTWENVKFIESDPAGQDGYIMGLFTIPGSTTDLLQTAVIEDLDVGLTSTNPVGMFEFQPYVLASRKDAPWGASFEEMIEYAQANPGELRYISRGPGAAQDIALTSYGNAAGGLEFEVIVGGTFAEIGAVIGAGEGDLAMMGVDFAKQFYDDGRLEVLVITGENPAPEPWTDVPTAKEFFGEDLPGADAWGTNTGLFVSQDTPECHRLWLRALVLNAYEREELREARNLVPGLTMVSLDKEAVLEMGRAACAAAAEVMETQDLIDPSVDVESACQ